MCGGVCIEDIMSRAISELIGDTYKGIEILLGSSSQVLCLDPEDPDARNSIYKASRNYIFIANNEVWSPYFESFAEFTDRNGISSIFIIPKPPKLVSQDLQLNLWLSSGCPKGQC